MRFWTVLLSLVVVAAVAVSASAQEKKERKKGDRPRISFKDMDANSDGKLIKDEYKAAMEKMMKEWKEKGGKKRGEKKE